MDGHGLTGRISLCSLPDELLLQILILLPVLQAVRTSVLSRRWARIWTELQIIHVDDTEVDSGGEPGRFARAVDSIIAVYSGQPSRTRCNFGIIITRNDNVDGGRITTWVRLAAELFDGDFVLSVELPSEREDSDEDESDSEEEESEIVEIPYFESAKKITLTLWNSLLRLALPTGARVFASLTELMLLKVHFADGANAALSEIVSSRCPCLVSLCLLHVRGVTALRIRTASLTDLNLSCVDGLRRLDLVALKLRVMTVQCSFVESQGAELLISAPLLLTLQWADCCPEHTNVGLIDNLNKLVVGEIPPITWGRGFIAHSNFDMIMRHFRRTQVLELYLPVHPELQGHRNLMEHIALPHQYAELNLNVEPNTHMFGMSMFLLLKRCIRLTTLHLKLSTHKGDKRCLSSCIWDNPASWKNQEIILKSLQEIVVRDFSDTSHEVDVVSFILKCAPSLQQIEIEVVDGVQLSEDTVLHFNEYHPVEYYY